MLKNNNNSFFILLLFTLKSHFFMRFLFPGATVDLTGVFVPFKGLIIFFAYLIGYYFITYMGGFIFYF